MHPFQEFIPPCPSSAPTIIDASVSITPSLKQRDTGTPDNSGCSNPLSRTRERVRLTYREGHIPWPRKHPFNAVEGMLWSHSLVLWTAITLSLPLSNGAASLWDIVLKGPKIEGWGLCLQGKLYAFTVCGGIASTARFLWLDGLLPCQPSTFI
jgi:hypothetical protein